MGIGWLIAGAIGLAALAGSSSSSSSSSRTTTTTYYRLPRTSTRRTTYTPHRSSSHYVTTSEQEKINFFDDYRALDVQIARLIGEGSGGIGLLVKAMKYGYLKNVSNLREYYCDLKEIRDYRNMLAHNKNRWCNMSSPKSWYRQSLSKVKSICYNYSSEVGRALYSVAKKRNHY